MQKQNKKVMGFNIVEVIIIIIISSLLSAIASGMIVNRNNRTSAGIAYSELFQDEDVKEFLDVYSDVLAKYYEDIDKKGAVESAIKGLMSYLGDQYTTYLDDNQTENLNSLLDGKYIGIGVLISISDKVVISEVYENTPAKKAGLMAGDEIIEIRDQLVSSLADLTKVTDLIKTSNGNVSMKILRNGEEKQITVEVKELDKPVVHSTILTNGEKKVGYLELDSFSSSVYEQFKSSLTKLESQSIDGLILDLRNNSGGYLIPTTNIASLFLEKGKVIFSLEEKDGNKDYIDETDEKRNYNIVVLVNDGTASAAEVLASSLKDSYGAKLVGITTYGKGKVQQTKSLSDKTMIKYTTARWLRANGECIDEIGIDPDYQAVIQKAEDGTLIDNQLNKALEVIFE